MTHNHKIEYRTYCSQYTGLIEGRGLESCKNIYQIMLKILNHSPQNIREKMVSFWEDGFKRIYNGLVSGEISGLYRWHSTPDNFNVHPLMLKAYNEGVNNAQILHNNGIFVRRLIHTSSPNGFQNFEISVYGETIEYFLGREIVFDIPYDNRYDILLEESYYKNIVIQNGDISNIKKLAINNANTHVTQFNRCPKCEGELSNPLFSKRLKCQRCNLSF